MTTLKRCALTLTFILFAHVINAQAQTPSIEVTTDSDAAQFSTQGKARSVHVEVYAPSGELVFESDGLDGQAIEWRMSNQKGERVADGVYLATITVLDSLGKKRKRIEQITVSSQQSPAQATGAPQESLAPTGTGTAGKLAKWTTAANLGNSVMTESASKIGVNIVPTAVLHVNQAQPPPVANNGTNVPLLLQTSGGKGGNTTVSGAVAGNGAGVTLLAGNGGDAPAGSNNGNGGNITLQPGSAGAGGGTAGTNGNVLIVPSGVGSVTVGKTVPTAGVKLDINGVA